MASYDAIKDLPLEIEECAFEGLELEDRRVRTADHGGQAARRRRGGDRRRRRLRRRRPRRPAEPRAARGARPLRHLRRVLARSSTGSTSSRPGAPERAEVSRDYRRWAYESAALDLALRQAGTNLAAALGREPKPLNFVNSLRLAGFDPSEKSTIKPVEERLAAYPTLRFKLDPFNDWDDELIAALVATGAVDSLDLKGFYKGTPVDVITDPELYAKLIEAFPDAWLEDPDVTDETRPLLDPVARAGHLGRADPLDRRHRGDALVAAATVNVKPSRFGPISHLFAAYDYCEERGIGAYGGGQTELGPGRGQIQYLASIFHPDTPNDTAPRGYNDPAQATAPGLPTSPLEPAIDALGFRWTGPQTA